MPKAPKFWYMVFRREDGDGKVLFGYFTKDFLKENDHLADTTLMHLQTKPLPAKVKLNTDYIYEEGIW